MSTGILLPPFPSAPVLAQRAVTPTAGVALVNGTQTILSYAVPADGLLHEVIVAATVNVTSGTSTGGACGVQVTAPALGPFAGYAGGQTGPTSYSFAGGTSGAPLLVPGGATVSVVQTSALSAGTAVCLAKIYAD